MQILPGKPDTCGWEGIFIPLQKLVYKMLNLSLNLPSALLLEDKEPYFMYRDNVTEEWGWMRLLLLP